MSDVSQDDKNLGMLTHLSGILLGFIVPLIIWLMNKDKTDKEWLNTEAKEALNFQITVAIGYVICVVLSFVVIGALMMPVLWIANIVFCIIAGLKAKDGVSYRYPFALRLIS
jgi:hypothetical protein